MKRTFLIIGIFFIVFGIAAMTEEIMGCINLPFSGFYYLFDTKSLNFHFLVEYSKYFVMVGLFITITTLIFAAPAGEESKINLGPFKYAKFGKWKKRRTLFQLFIYGLIILHIVMVYSGKSDLPALCPLSLGDLASLGVFGISAAFWATIFILVLVFGRALCSWACVYTPIQEQSINLLSACGKNPKKVKFKQFGLIYILTAIFWGSIIFNILTKTNKLTFDINQGYKIIPLEVFLGAVVTMIPLAMFFTHLLGSRFFCKYLCPIGGTMSLYSKFGLLKIMINKEKCVGCNMCEKNCPMSVGISKYIENGSSIRDSGCIVCGDCIDACKKNALSYGFGLGLSNKKFQEQTTSSPNLHEPGKP